MSYLTYLKTMLVTAVEETFDEHYPVEQFRGVHCSIEYPVEPANYPGIWVDYEDGQELQIAGVDHYEKTEVRQDGTIVKFTRWRFQGYVSFTVTALTSRERDALYDELVKVFAFGKEDPNRLRFRSYIEDNDFIAANIDFDQIAARGNAAAPGTPWGTDEIIYERTINLEIIGEFIADDSDGGLLPLSGFLITGTVTLGPGPDGEYEVLESGITDWH